MRIMYIGCKIARSHHMINYMKILNHKSHFSFKNIKIKRSVFIIFLISYLITFSVSILFNVIYYSRMESKMLDNAKRTSLAMLNQLKIDVDNKLEIVNQISNNLVFDKKIEMMLKGSYSQFSYKDVMEDMMVYPKYDFIYDYYIYNSYSAKL